LVKKGIPDEKDVNKWHCDCKVKGNFKIYLFRNPLIGKKKKVMELWHNTLFLDM
jgi:hypothetical protein